MMVFSLNSINICGADSNSKTASQPPKFVKDEILVKFKKGISKKDINKINKEYGAYIKGRKLIGGYRRLTFRNKDKSVRKLIEEYRALDEVEFAEPNYIVTATDISNEGDTSNPWKLDSHEFPGRSFYSDIWEMQTDRTSVINAVIDTGVNYYHDDLVQCMWINLDEIADNGIDDDNNGFVDDIYGWDFVNNDNDPFDDNSHGTHVAGIISEAGNNSVSGSSVNWPVKIMALKFLSANGSGSTVDAINAIDYAVKMGAKVLNNSWSGDGFSRALSAAISKANKTGALFITTASNNEENSDSAPHYPSSYNIQNIVSVIANDNKDTLSSLFNSATFSVHVTRPNVSIYNTNPGNGNNDKNFASSATPYASAAASLVMAAFPNKSLFEIKARIVDSFDFIQTFSENVRISRKQNHKSNISEIKVPTKQKLSIIYDDNMESGTNGWVVSGPTALWNQSSQRTESLFTAWYYGNDMFSNYDTGTATNGGLISPDIDLTNVTGSTLVFSHFLDAEELSGYDEAIVRISNDGGISYSDIFTRLTTNGSFVQETVNISIFDGCMINVQFFFDSKDDILNNFEGWYVDDIKIKGVLKQEPPVANAGEDQIVKDIDGNGFELITLDGMDSTGSSSIISAYVWKEGNLLLGTDTLLVTNFSIGTHTVSLTVTNNDGHLNSDYVSITVNANVTPVTDIEQEQQ